MAAMELRLERSVVRPLRPEDAPSFALHANDRGVWENLRDAFPHPYAEQDARSFIELATGREPGTGFAIVVDGQAVGCTGFTLRTDVERIGAEFGYWLGRQFWNRGIVSEVVRAITPWALEAYGLERVYALPYLRNVASCRVLEKAGFVREGVMRRSAIKEGVVLDQALYAFVPGAGDAQP